MLKVRTKITIFKSLQRRDFKNFNFNLLSLDNIIHFHSDFGQEDGGISAKSDNNFGVSTNSTLFNYIGLSFLLIALAVALTFFCKFKKNKKQKKQIKRHENLVRNRRENMILTQLNELKLIHNHKTLVQKNTSDSSDSISLNSDFSDI